MKHQFMNAQSSNKRIAKNTAYLYVRMLFLTAINIYTIRITLNILGDINYGIYNVVASIVGSMGFITGTMTSATQRFLSYHLGKADYKSYEKTFSILFLSFLILSIICLIIGEIFGLFFIERYLNIPIEKIGASKIVFQTALLIFIISMMTIPYNASIIAHEDMNFFAYFTIIDGLLKLFLVYVLCISNYDHLVLYGILMACQSVIMYIIYWLFCKCKYEYCRVRLVWDGKMVRELSTYTGWNLFGSISNVLCNQGQNILLNIYFGPVVNAAKSIGDRIQHTVQSFATNFYTAVSPQIVKSYAQYDFSRAYNLVISSTRFSFCLLLAIVFPLIVIMPELLYYWLGEASINPWMVGFGRLALIYNLVSCLEQPITQLIRATGNIKRYQIKVGTLTLLYIPISWICLKMGANAFSTMITLIALYLLVMIMRLYIVNRQVGLSLYIYYHKVGLPIVKIIIYSLLSYIVISQFDFPKSIWGVFICTSVSFLVALVGIYFVGLTKSDKSYIKNWIAERINK